MRPMGISMSANIQCHRQGICRGFLAYMKIKRDKGQRK